MGKGGTHSFHREKYGSIFFMFENNVVVIIIFLSLGYAKQYVGRPS